MRKNESGVPGYEKHTGNNTYARRGINKRVRKNVKLSIKKEFENGNVRRDCAS